MHIFDSFKSLNMTFWKSFKNDPETCSFFLKLAIAAFFSDLVCLILIPKSRRDELARKE
jgi:hypothetical protein